MRDASKSGTVEWVSLLYVNEITEVWLFSAHWFYFQCKFEFTVEMWFEATLFSSAVKGLHYKALSIALLLYTAVW